MPGLLDRIFPGLPGMREGRSLRVEELAAKRQQLADEAEKRKQYQRLPGLLNTSPGMPGGVPFRDAGMSGEERQQGLLDVAARTMPQETLQGLLAPDKGERMETSYNTYRAMFPNQIPGSDEFYKGYIAFKGLEDPSQGLENNKTRLEIERMMRESREADRAREEKEVEKKIDFRTGEVTLNRSLAQLAEAQAINDRLRDTFLAPGSFGVDWKAPAAQLTSDLQRLFGYDGDKAQEVVSDYNKLKKLTSSFIVENFDRLAGTGAVTVSKQQLLTNSMAGVGNTAETNDFIFARSIESLLDSADIQGFDVPNRGDYEQLSKSLHEVKKIKLGNGVEVVKQ